MCVRFLKLGFQRLSASKHFRSVKLLSWMIKEWNMWNKWYFIQQLLVNLYGKRDADPQMRKQMFTYTDGQQI